MSDKTIVGTCSICGGPVVMFNNWASTEPQTPYCSCCGAMKKESGYGPVISMVPVKAKGGWDGR